MENLSEMLKGVLEGMVLEIISCGEIYGYEIVRRLNKLGLAGMAEGTVYMILLRFEKNNLVNITKKPSEIGPPRKFYVLNKNGERELAEFWDKWNFIIKITKQLKNGGMQ